MSQEEDKNEKHKVEKTYMKLYTAIKFMLRVSDEGIEAVVVKHKLKRDLGYCEKRLRPYFRVIEEMHADGKDSINLATHTEQGIDELNKKLDEFIEKTIVHVD